MLRRSELIKKVRNITAAVADAMAAVSRFVQCGTDERDMLGGCRFEADVIKDNYTPLREALTEILECIRVDWNEIISNDMLVDEVKTMLEACSSFHQTVSEFDETAIAHSREIECLLGDAWMPREYLVMILEWEDDAEAIRMYITKNYSFGLRLDDPFAGVAFRLRKFFTGVSDKEIEDFVMNGVSLKGKPRWMQNKRQAVVMGMMLDKTCLEMNQSFLFTKQDGTPIKLKYSSNMPDLDKTQYEIYPILKTLQDEKNKRKG